MLFILVVLGPRVRGRLALRPMLPFLGVGVVFGLSYVSLFEAFYRGRVTVVSPIIATESLWGVALSILLIRHTELVGRRVLIGAVLIVAGGVLIVREAGGLVLDLDGKELDMPLTSTARTDLVAVGDRRTWEALP